MKSSAFNQFVTKRVWVEIALQWEGESASKRVTVKRSALKWSCRKVLFPPN